MNCVWSQTENEAATDFSDFLRTELHLHVGVQYCMGPKKTATTEGNAGSFAERSSFIGRECTLLMDKMESVITYVFRPKEIVKKGPKDIARKGPKGIVKKTDTSASGEKQDRVRAVWTAWRTLWNVLYVHIGNSREARAEQAALLGAARDTFISAYRVAVIPKHFQVYVHIINQHLVEMVELHGSITSYSGQSLEAVHQVIKRCNSNQRKPEKRIGKDGEEKMTKGRLEQKMEGMTVFSATAADVRPKRKRCLRLSKKSVVPVEAPTMETGGQGV